MPAAAKRTPRAPVLDVLIQSPRWAAEPDAETLLRRAIGEAARAVSDPRAAEGEVAIVLTDDAALLALNGRWRGRNEPTNVLSFPSDALAAPGGAAPLGDIAIAYETTAREALAQGKPFAHHLAHLAVHGFLHLLGYDHESDDPAAAMERLESRILDRLGVADPYAVDDI